MTTHHGTEHQRQRAELYLKHRLRHRLRVGILPMEEDRDHTAPNS